MTNEEKKIGFKIINFNKETRTPVFKENKAGGWIDYGKKNDYPTELLDIYNNRSNKHKAIINRKAKMIAGGGVDDTLLSAELTAFFDKYNSKGDNLDSVVSKVAYDLEIFGGFNILVKFTNNGEKIGAVEHIPYDKIRESTTEGVLMFSNDWKQAKKEEYAPVEIPLYNTAIAQKNPIQIFNYSEYNASNSYYPIPAYSSTLQWIEADYEISNFHLSSIQNGFSAGFILNFATGVPSTEEMEEAATEFKKNYSGSDNAGKFILTYSDGIEQKPELIPIELNSTDDRYMNLAEQIRNEIMIGHEVTNPQLFGVLVAGSLGGKNEMVESLEIFQAVYIDSKQKVIEDVLTRIAKGAGFNESVELVKYTL